MCILYFYVLCNLLYLYYTMLNEGLIVYPFGFQKMYDVTQKILQHIELIIIKTVC